MSEQEKFPLCSHRGHYSFSAKRLVYKGRGSYDYALFTVWSHRKKWKYAKEDTLCNKEYGVFVVIGKPQDNELTVIRPKGE